MQAFRTARFSRARRATFFLSLLVAAGPGSLHAATNYATPFSFTTLAGVSAIGSQDGIGPAARFKLPVATALDSVGNLYVTDIQNHTVRKITPAGVVSTVAGRAGFAGFIDATGGAARFRQPAGMAIDGSGNLFVAERGNSAIRKITPVGVVTLFAGSPSGDIGSRDGTGTGALFNEPLGMTIDGAGNLYVADNYSTIRKITPAGVVSTLAGSAGLPGTTNGTGAAARFENPQFLALDGSGNLYVTDNTTLIRRITPGGAVSTFADLASQGPYLTGVAVDSSGNVYAGDSSNNVVYKISPGGIVSTLAGVSGIGSALDGPGNVARFREPFGMTLDPAGNLLLADVQNHAIRKITPAGFVSTVAGFIASIGSSDGTGSAARFASPSAIAIDSSGLLYVADENNQTIRKITQAGVVTTLAGSPGVPGGIDGTGAAARFYRPTGVAVDSSGHVYVADNYNHNIRKITPAGVVSTFAGSPGSSDGGEAGSVDAPGTLARFNSPRGIAVDASGNIYVADTGNHVIRKITPAGVVTTFAGAAGIFAHTNGSLASARFYNPIAVAVDASGNLYVTDQDDANLSGSNNIRKISAGGVVSDFAGLYRTAGVDDGTGAAARFYTPAGLATDAAGNVYVTDSAATLLRRITPAGVVTTLAGASFVADSTEGNGPFARFALPVGVAVASSGAIYVVDADGNSIRVGVPGVPIARVVPSLNVPSLIPSGSAANEARVVTEQPGSGVIVAMSGTYAVRPSGGSVQSLSLPSYTNPQPYNLSYVVRLLANGQPDPTFTSAPGSDGTVNAVAVQSDGKIIVGGSFTTFNGVLFRNLARLHPDGRSDATLALGSGPDSQVNAIALQPDGKILVAGTFLNFAGQSRPYLLRLNSTGAADPGFAPALNGTVNTLALQPDGKILVGGNFTSAGGASRARLARLLANGTADPAFNPGTGADNEVVTLVVQPDGAIVAAGDFTTFAGQPRARIVRVLPTGAIDPDFLSTASANNTVLSLGLEPNGALLLGGAFTQVNGADCGHLARLKANGAIDLDFDPGAGTNKDVRSVLRRSDGTVFLGGLFDQYQGTGVNAVVAIVGTPVATSFVRAPFNVTVSAGGTARFVAEASGTGSLSYQWLKNGAPIAGATDATLTLSNVAFSAEGRYTLQVSSATGGTVTTEATLTVVASAPAQIVNLSVLTSLDQPDATFSLGFVIGGTGTSGAKALLARAGGPSLAQFGVGNPLADPKLQFFAGSTLAGENDNWNGTPALSALTAQVGAFAYTAATSKDAAFAPANLTTAANTVVVSGVGGTTGAVIAEVYDATPAAAVTPTTPRLINVSVLKHIPAGATLTAGFVLTGNTSRSVLIRAIGPTLGNFGVGSPLSDPRLTLNQGSTPIATNDNWNADPALRTVFGTVGAFALDAASKDAAVLITLEPGSYTAQASGVGLAAGSALVEVYEVP